MKIKLKSSVKLTNFKIGKESDLKCCTAGVWIDSLPKVR